MKHTAMHKDDPLAAEPFSYFVTKDNRLHIFCNGKLAKVLKDRAAMKFLDRIEYLETKDQQLAMAKETGQFKFGNER